MKKEELERIQNIYGKFVSFALWADKEMNDVEIIKHSFPTLHTKLIFVGLNATGKMRVFENFHSKSRFDRRFRDVLKNSLAEGAYLTDIHKGSNEKKSIKVVSEIKKDELKYKSHLDKEFKDIGAEKSPIVALGSATYEFLKKWYPERVYKIYHPAAWQIPDERFKESVSSALDIIKKL